MNYILGISLLLIAIFLFYLAFRSFKKADASSQFRMEDVGFKFMRAIYGKHAYSKCINYSIIGTIILITALIFLGFWPKDKEEYDSILRFFKIV